MQIDTKAIHQQTIVLNFTGGHKKKFLHPYQFFSAKKTALRAVFVILRQLLQRQLIIQK